MNGIIKNIEFYLIMFLPISIVIGNFIANTCIFLIIIFFVIDLFKKKIKFNNFFLYILIILLILLSANLVSSVNKLITIKGLIGLIKNILILISLINFFQKKEDNFDKFVMVVFYLILFVAFDTFVQFLFGKDIFGFILQESHGYRLSGPFGDEYVVGAFLSKMLFISIFYMINNKRLNNESYKLIYIFIIYFIIFLSKERAAFYLTSLALIIYFNATFINNRVKIFSFILISLISVTSIVSYNKNLDVNNPSTFYAAKIKYLIKPIFYLGIKDNVFVNSHLTEGYIKSNKNKTILDTRYGSHFLTANEIFKSNKLFGSGIKTFRIECAKDKYSKISSQSYNSRCNTHPHQIFLEILSEGGIFIFLYFLFLLFYLIYYLFKKTNLALNPKICLFLILFILFFPVQTTGSFFSTFNGLFYFIGMAICIYKSKIKIINYS